MSSVLHRHLWANRLQSGLLILFMLGLLTMLGQLLLGEDGLWITLVAGLVALLIEPVASSRLTLRLYRAQPIAVSTAPQLWQTLRRLAERAGLPALPSLYYVPSPMVNAFAVGNEQSCAIALSDGLLRRLSAREVAGVLAHQIAHIAHRDLRVMGLADYLSRLTFLLSLMGMLLLLTALPLLMIDDVIVNWPALLLLMFTPQLALLAQMGLSRIREFDADTEAAALTGDPQGFASALDRIDQATRDWRGILMPGLGNPEPSWLRTHPATRERIRRLLALRPATRQLDEEFRHLDWLPAAPAKSRWRAGGSGTERLRKQLAQVVSILLHQ